MPTWRSATRGQPDAGWCVIRRHDRPPPPDVMPFDAAPASAPVDLDAFLASVERRAFRIAELAIGHREDALDVVQEAMIRLVAYRDRPASEWTPLFWSILRSQVADRHRRNGVRRRFMAVLGRDEDQREAYLLRELQGLDVADTAAAMGCSDGSVKTHLSRAMSALRTYLEDWR